MRSQAKAMNIDLPHDSDAMGHTTNISLLKHPLSYVSTVLAFD